MAAAQSPASSPRLPSPPPIAEDQLGPASPGVASFEDHGKLLNNTADTGASRRIRPGTKAEDMAEGPPLVDIQEIDSAFQLTEHLKALHNHYTHPPSSPNTSTPITAEIAHELAQPPPNTSREIWLYELGRFLIQKTNAIILALFADSPPCSAQTCSEMRASEWQYLCAVHDPPKSCAAIDYSCHTLDWAATTLTSSKMFPSRLNLGSGAAGAVNQHSQPTTDKVLQHQMKELTNIFRRVYRIYAHAWFQHREMFWRVEGRTGLYVLFKTVCDEYGLIQPENYTIPAEAEGLEPLSAVKEEGRDVGKEDERPMMLLARPKEQDEDLAGEEVGNKVLAEGHTTKRHRRDKSEGGSSIATAVIREEEEEEDDAPGLRDVEEPKPGNLERHATEMKIFAESLPQRQKVEQADEEAAAQQVETGDDDEAELDPIPGIKRSETVKPPAQKENEEVAKAEEDEPVSKDAGNDVETTIVEVEPEEALPPTEPKIEGESEKSELDDKVDLTEPQVTKAGDPEEAAKSVAD